MDQVAKPRRIQPAAGAPGSHGQARRSSAPDGAEAFGARAVRRAWWGLAATILLALLAAPALGAVHWYAHLPNSASPFPSTILLGNDGAAPATATVTDPSGLAIAYTVPPATVLEAPMPLNLTFETGIVRGGFRVDAAPDIGVGYHDPITPTFSNDAGRVPSTRELGLRHLVMGLPTTLPHGFADRPFIVVVATEPATTVRVRPTADIRAGPLFPAILAGTTHSVVLGPHDALQLIGDGDLIGSEVEADKPVAVYAGAACFNFDGSACDHVSDHMPPLERAGDTFVHCTPTPLRVHGYDLVRVLAATGPADVTVTTAAGATTYSLAAGGTALHRLEEDAVITSTRAVLAWTITGPGLNRQDYGDPDILTLAPAHLWGRNHIFLSPGHPDWQNAYSVAGPVGASVTLDGVTAGLAPIGSTGYGCAVANVLPGSHQVRGAVPVFATSFAYGMAVSYHTEALYAQPEPHPPVARIAVTTFPDPCLPGVVVLDGTRSSDPDGPITAWSWDLGDGTTATGPTVRHGYPGMGPYTVRLEVLDDAGLPSSATATVVPPEDHNCPPRIHVPSTAILPVGASVELCATGEDPDGDPLAFVLLRAPDGGRFDPATACWTWTATEDFRGRHCVLFLVTDGHAQDVACTLVVVRLPGVEVPDSDRDGVADDQDNCPEAPNTDQADADRDGEGDLCDPVPGPASALGTTGAAGAGDDLDRDGVPDASDLCPRHADPAQRDLDLDRVGDACDIDADGDGIAAGGEYPDVCPLAPDADQADTDGDGAGDACDPSPASAARAAPVAPAAPDGPREAPMPLVAAVAGLATALAARRRAAGARKG